MLKSKMEAQPIYLHILRTIIQTDMQRLLMLRWDLDRQQVEDQEANPQAEH